MPPYLDDPTTFPGQPPGGPPGFIPPTHALLNFDIQGFDLNDHQDTRLRTILQNMSESSAFDDYFSGLQTSGRSTIIDRNAIESLLGRGLTNQARIAFLNRILGTGDTAPPPAPPPTAGGGGGGGHIGGGGGGGGGGGSTGNPLDESSFIPEEVNQAMIDRILAMLENPGIPSDVLDAMRSSNQEQGLMRERERLLRRADDFSGRGLFGSGVANRDLERIEQEESTLRMQQEDQLNMQNALQALQSIQAAFGGTLGLGQLNLGEHELEIRNQLERLAIDAQRAIARGQLGLGYANLNQNSEQFNAQMALQQYLLNLQYGGSFGGSGGGAGFADPSLGQFGSGGLNGAQYAGSVNPYAY